MTKSLYRVSRVMVTIRRNKFGGFCFLASTFKVNELKTSPRFYTSSLPTFHILSINIVRSFVLVLSPKDGTRARARLIRVLHYEHEHHFIEHEYRREILPPGK